ncbi:MAG TPA: hypothetical protein VGO59_20170 [Verrucomicrobiae bacterium]|jgi:hypothetical protein
MNTTKYLKVFCLTLLALPLLAASPCLAGDASTPISPLEPLAFLVGGEWEAKLPPQADGRQISIMAHFTWANNHQAIRISNNYALGAKMAPYVDGIYAWHPGKRVIVFSYVDARGNFYEGTVKPETNGLLHEFAMTDPKGQVTQFTARQTRDGGSAWVNEIFTRQDGHLTPEVKVRYEKVKTAPNKN